MGQVHPLTLSSDPFSVYAGLPAPFVLMECHPNWLTHSDHWFWQSEQVWENTNQCLECAAEWIKWLADCHSDGTQYNPGDHFCLSARDMWNTQGYRKLNPRYIEPYKILQRINEVTYKLNLPCHCCIAPSFHVSCLKPVINGPLATDSPPITPPESLDIDSLHH